MELRAPQPGYSLAEYFRLADASPTKLEFKDGQIIDMAGASYNHNRISANILGEMRSRLKGEPCEATGSDTRVRVSERRHCYPDVVVVCGNPIFDPLDPSSTVTNPSVIFEVLSPTTESADRGEKFFNYIRIASMQTYFLVAFDKPRVESFIRQNDGSWRVGPVAEGIDAVLQIASLNIELPLREIYARVDFNSAANA